MNRLLKFSGICWVLAATFLAGCASLPNGDVHYYLPKSDISFKVVRIVTCDDQDHLLFSDVVTTTVTNSADPKAKQTINLSKLKGTFTDTDLKVDLYDDGRLKGINSSSTGEGQDILKTAVGIAAVLSALTEPPRFPSECATLKKLGKGKPVTFTFEGPVARDAQNFPLELAPVDKLKKLDGIAGPVCVTAGAGRSIEKYTVSSKDADQFQLQLQEPGLVPFTVTAGMNDTCGSAKIWTGNLLVAQAGTPYTVPIPSPLLFGKEAMSASFSEAGGLTSLQFTSTSGTGQALGVVNTALTTYEGKAAAKAAQLKAESDLIAQEQRLLQCKAKPADCSK